MKSLIAILLVILPAKVLALNEQDFETCRQIHITQTVPSVVLNGASTCQCDSATGQIFSLALIPENERVEAYKAYLADRTSGHSKYVTFNCSGQ